MKKNLFANTTGTVVVSHFSVDGNTILVDALAKRVGIGAIAPTKKTDVAGNENSNELSTIASVMTRTHTSTTAI